MLTSGSTLLLSATDLVNYLGCTHATALDLAHVGEHEHERPHDEYHELLAEKGLAHEQDYLARLKREGRTVAEIAHKASRADRWKHTTDAMAAGADVIYQGAIGDTPWHGYSDFLIRVDGKTPSRFGAWSYEVADTKLSHSAKPKHAIQLAVYSRLLESAQGVLPDAMHVVLGSGEQVTLRTSDFIHYADLARVRLERFSQPPIAATTAEPNPHCTFCHWKEACEAEWERTEHLSLVAGMSRVQQRRLRAAAIATMRALAKLPYATRVPHMQPETLERVRSQARLQIGKRDTGKNTVELRVPEPLRGFARLPHPDEGDLFFDMEGDPLYPDGLEYLFGFDYLDHGTPAFKAFWAHDRRAEKKAFEDTVDLIIARINAYPRAHVYHYANYEERALKTLAMRHGTREVEIDRLLRDGKLVDLYRVVAEGIRTSEPKYSLKNLEVFYTGARAAGVKTAGDSIVVYERWRRLGDEALLRDIEHYNEEDCHSTRACRDWLLTLRPDTVTWFSVDEAGPEDNDKREAREEREAATAALQASLVEGVAEADRPWRELLGNLLDFHRREARYDWWEMFKRQKLSSDELIDDAECLAGLMSDPAHPPRQEKRSMVYTFRFPPQDVKMGVGDKPLRTPTLEPAGEIIELDADEGRVALKLGPSRSDLEEPLNLIPAGPRDDNTIRGAIARYAQAVADGAGGYDAITAILRKDKPRLTRHTPSAPDAAHNSSALDAAVRAIASLDASVLLVQGPPGSGKTYTTAHAIVHLIGQGKRIGVASNSHKAVNNVLATVEEVAQKAGVSFSGIKKSSDEDGKYESKHGLIGDTTENKFVDAGTYQLYGGTAWLFAREQMDQMLDYLFIDEAGQVSLANAVAMGVSARNIVLVGDQMQLSQPVKGSHPGGSGASVLDHMLGDYQTVPEDRGIFLGETWRLNPGICGFISEAVYEGRLRPAAGNERQSLVLADAHDASLAPAGLRFVGVEHEGCTQDSEEEAVRLCAAYDSLLASEWIDRDGARHRIGTNDILVVSPYNMQVNLLKSRLPAGARVGTVDKFQGQEAAMVLISMATSSGEDIPRNIDFLFSRNRLNVAISRARCLAVVFANPRLLEVSCSTIEQMRLVNTLCWVKSYAEEGKRAFSRTAN